MWNKDEWFMKERSASLLDAMGLDMLSNKWAKQKREEFILCSTSDSSKARIPETREPSQREEEKNRRLLEEEVSRMKIPSFMESVCTILRRFFALELRGTARHRIFDQIYCCEWNSSRQRSAWRSTSMNTRPESWIHRSLINRRKNLKRLDSPSRVVCKLILRVLRNSFSRSLLRPTMFFEANNLYPSSVAFE